MTPGPWLIRLEATSCFAGMDGLDMKNSLVLCGWSHASQALSIDCRPGLATFEGDGNSTAGVSPLVLTRDARRALDRGYLRSYLHAITAPLSFQQGLANFAHSISYTTFSFDADPVAARRALCRH